MMPASKTYKYEKFLLIIHFLACYQHFYFRLTHLRLWVQNSYTIFPAQICAFYMLNLYFFSSRQYITSNKTDTNSRNTLMKLSKSLCNMIWILCKSLIFSFPRKKNTFSTMDSHCPLLGVRMENREIVFQGQKKKMYSPMSDSTLT